MYLEMEPDSCSCRPPSSSQRFDHFSHLRPATTSLPKPVSRSTNSKEIHTWSNHCIFIKPSNKPKSQLRSQYVTPSHPRRSRLPNIPILQFWSYLLEAAAIMEMMKLADPGPGRASCHSREMADPKEWLCFYENGPTFALAVG